MEGALRNWAEDGKIGIAHCGQEVEIGNRRGGSNRERCILLWRDGVTRCGQRVLPTRAIPKDGGGRLNMTKA